MPVLAALLYKQKWLKKKKLQHVGRLPLTDLPSLTDRESDFVGFDASNIRQEAEDERQRYRDLVATYGEHLVAR